MSRVRRDVRSTTPVTNYGQIRSTTEDLRLSTSLAPCPLSSTDSSGSPTCRLDPEFESVNTPVSTLGSMTNGLFSSDHSNRQNVYIFDSEPSRPTYGRSRRGPRKRAVGMGLTGSFPSDRDRSRSFLSRSYIKDENVSPLTPCLSVSVTGTQCVGPPPSRPETWVSRTGVGGRDYGTWTAPPVAPARENP